MKSISFADSRDTDKIRSASLMHTAAALMLLGSGVAQLVRVPPFHSKDSKFESRCPHGELVVSLIGHRGLR